MEWVAIVGAGVVGAANGYGLQAAGHTVTLVDVCPDRVAQLRDAGLDARGRLSLHGAPSSYIFLTLPTPRAGGRYDLTAFEQGVRDVGHALAQVDVPHTVVVRSTVPPGTTDGLVRPLLEQTSGKREGRGFQLACMPEFLREASAADDFRWPWITIIGARSKRIRERLAALMSPFGGELRLVEQPATAEMIKCAHNLFNATKISFWNEMWLVCRRLGIPHDEVACAVSRSAEGSFNPQYGIRGGAPYGGTCLPKDSYGFLGFAAQHGIAVPLLSAVVDVNERMAASVQAELVELESTGLLESLTRPGER